MSGYIGNIPVPQATQTRQSFTATASQTTFNTSGYSPGYIDVFLNGVKLAPADYTATNGSDVVLAVGAASNDILEIVAYEIFQVVDQAFTGNFSVDSPTFVVDSTNNRVGIGTSSPSAKAHILNTGVSTTKGDVYLGKLSSSGLGAGYYHEIGFGNNSTQPPASIGFISTLGSGGTRGDLIFSTRSTTTGTDVPTERMRIDSSGNVGIGTTSPSTNYETALHLNAPSFVNLHLTTNATGTTGSDGFNLVTSSASTSLINQEATPLIFSTSATERMRIDSSGRVGIGTSSPNNKLSLVDASGSLVLDMGGSNGSGSYGYATISTVLGSSGNGYGDLTIGTSSAGTVSERMRIDSSGNVGIGTSSPSQKAEVSNNANSSTWLKISNSDTGIGAASGILFGNNTGDAGAISLLSGAGDGSLFLRTLSTNALKLGTNNTEAMRLDSGNLLVGTTNTSLYNNASDDYGFVISQSGTYQQSANNTILAYYNRQNGNGDIIQFRQNSAIAGVIGTELYNSDLYIGNSDTGVIFQDANDAIQPFNPSTNGFRDAAINLGFSSTRFKDLYLSGGVYLGGTGSSNYLDDYEEGTWTPVVSSGSATVNKATYTKIGNLVMVQADVTLGGTRNTSTFTVSGLPFANGLGRWTAISMYHGAAIGSYQQVVGLVNQGNAVVTFQHMGGDVIGTAFSNTYLNIGGTYMTD